MKRVDLAVAAHALGITKGAVRVLVHRKILTRHPGGLYDLLEILHWKETRDVNMYELATRRNAQRLPLARRRSGSVMTCTIDTAANGITGEIVVVGEFDSEAAESVAALAAVYLDKPDIGCIAFDLAAVTFLDSAGIASLVIARNEAQAAGKTVILRSPSDRAVRVLSVVGLDHVFPIED